MAIVLENSKHQRSRAYEVNGIDQRRLASHHKDVVQHYKPADDCAAGTKCHTAAK